MVFMLSQAQDAVLWIKQYCAAILRAKINNNSRKTYRGFAAYEARQGGVMGFYESKKEVLSTAHAAVANPFQAEKYSKSFGLILCNLTHKPIHKIQQTQAWPT